MSSRPKTTDGGANRTILNGGNLGYSPPQHNIDVALLQTLYPRLLARCHAERIAGLDTKQLGQLVGKVRDMLRDLAHSPYRVLTQRQRAIAEIRLSPEEIETIRARFTVKDVQPYSLPLKPPSRPKPPEDE